MIFCHSRRSKVNPVTVCLCAFVLADTLGGVTAAQHRLPADTNCWPVGNLVFPPGSQEVVAKRTAEFLIKAEDVPLHPYWPKGLSGITIGVGWDLGHHSRDELRKTWAELGQDKLTALEAAVGLKGQAAGAISQRLQTIEIPRDLSMRVLVRSLNEYYCPFVIQLFPGLEKLPTEVQVVFVSLVFNRGASMGHEPDWRTAKEVDARWEIREMRADVERENIFGIYIHLGTMKRLWEKSGPGGLRFRRRDEQALIRPYVDQQLRWEENQERLKNSGLPACAK